MLIDLKLSKELIYIFHRTIIYFFCLLVFFSVNNAYLVRVSIKVMFNYGFSSLVRRLHTAD